jgi:hypothetical protein
LHPVSDTDFHMALAPWLQLPQRETVRGLRFSARKKRFDAI